MGGLVVDQTNYPKIYESFVLILRDNGGINRFEPQPKSFTVPIYWESKLKDCENALKSLTSKQFETVCVGEQTEAEEILNKTQQLTYVGKLLNEYFNDWYED